MHGRDAIIDERMEELYAATRDGREERLISLLDS